MMRQKTEGDGGRIFAVPESGKGVS
jgi:hypothetical protein